MKENLNSTCHRVDSTEVRAFVQITAVARESEVFDGVSTAMLPSDNVFDLMRHGGVFLSKQAVLAAINRSVPDREPGRGIHF